MSKEQLYTPEGYQKLVDELNYLSTTRRDEIKKDIAEARQVAAYLIREKTNLPYKKIGSILERDHATIMSSIGKVQLNLRTMDNFKIQVDRILKDIERKS